MTISTHHVDSVINAYNKQSKLKAARTAPSEDKKEATGEDLAIPSQKSADKAEAYKKISYSVIDVILKKKKL